MSADTLLEKVVRWPSFNLNPDFTHVGPWTNWNDDYADGGRITVPKKEAELIMVFTGVLFVFMEAGLCSLVTLALFAYHRHRRPYNPPLPDQPPAASATAPTRTSMRRRKPPRDAMWHQRQASLRNSGDFLSITGRFLSLWLTYRRLRPRTSLFWVLVASLCALVTAGVFLVALPFLITYVMLHEDGHEVLISSKRCAMYDTDNSTYWQTDMTGQLHMAMQYADACYDEIASSELCDKYFVKPKLETTNTTTHCPFEPPEVCLLPDGSSDNKPAIKIETLGLNSHNDLGLNAKSSDRIEFNRTVVCAPLDLERYSEQNELEGRMDVFLGNVDGFEDDPTYVGFTDRSASYQRFTLHGYLGDIDWYPVKDLQVDGNSTISLVFLHNPKILVRTTDKLPCRDPFFNASTFVSREDGDGYMPSKAVTAIGCLEYLTFTNPSNPTPDTYQVGLTYRGFRAEFRTKDLSAQTKEITEALKLNSKQRETLELTLWSFSNAGAIGTMINVMGVSALRAAKVPGIFGRILNAIPHDQWKIEVQYWVDIGLAALQQEFVRFATGPGEVHDKYGVDLRSNDTKKDGGVCGQQKIKRTDFKNFRRPGFIALATIGAILIVLPWLAIKVVIWLGRQRQWPFVLEWLSYGELQLLRMANEGAGVQGWQGCDSEIPFIEADEMAHIDVADPRHPHMRHLSSTELVEGASRHGSIHSSQTTRLLG